MELWLSNSTFGNTSKETKTLIQKNTLYIHPYVHVSIIYYSHDLEADQMFYRWVDKKLWYTYTMEYYSAIKKKEILPFATAWMDLKSIILSEICWSENKYCRTSLTHMWNLMNKMKLKAK